MSTLIEASAIEWNTAAPPKRSWSPCRLNDEAPFDVGLFDVIGAIYQYLYSATMALAGTWLSRRAVRSPPTKQTQPSAEQPPNTVLLSDSAPWLKQLVEEHGYKQVMDHGALVSEGGAFPVDHLFRALAVGGMVQDSRVLLKRTQASDGVPDAALDVVTVWQLGSDVCGHAGIVHGGMTAAMIDESYGYLLYLAKAQRIMDFKAVLTASLEVSFKQPLMPEGPVCVTSWVSRREGRKIWVESAVSDRPLLRTGMPGAAPEPEQGNQVYATSKALFLVPRPEGATTAALQQASEGRTDTLDINADKIRQAVMQQ